MKNIKKHHLVQYLLIPIIMIGSDLFIGFYGHYSGTVDNIFSYENLVCYFTNTDNIYELIIIFAIAIIVMFSVEYVVQERTKKRK